MQYPLTSLKTFVNRHVQDAEHVAKLAAAAAVTAVITEAVFDAVEGRIVEAVARLIMFMVVVRARRDHIEPDLADIAAHLHEKGWLTRGTAFWLRAPFITAIAVCDIWPFYNGWTDLIPWGCFLAADILMVVEHARPERRSRRFIRYLRNLHQARRALIATVTVRPEWVCVPLHRRDPAHLSCASVPAAGPFRPPVRFHRKPRGPPLWRSSTRSGSAARGTATQQRDRPVHELGTDDRGGGSVVVEKVRHDSGGNDGDVQRSAGQHFAAPVQAQPGSHQRPRSHSCNPSHRDRHCTLHGSKLTSEAPCRRRRTPHAAELA